MLMVRPGKEIMLRVQNDTGVLAQVAKILSERGVNVNAMSGWVEGAVAVIRIVADDHLHAMDTLKVHNYRPREESAVLMETAHKPGMLRQIAEVLAEERIDIRHLYATANDHDDRCLVVMSTSDDERVMVLMND